MDKVTASYGCGRAMWEYNANLNRFGTPMALMLLPNYTGGCVDSMEGLLFESATTTPYHFINQAELSVSPSEAMVPATTGIVYGPVNVPLGIQHLQLLGVKYFMASSPPIQDQADADPALTLVATTGPWHTAVPGPDRHHDVEDLPGPRLVARDPADRDARRAHRGRGGPEVVAPRVPALVRGPGDVGPADGGRWPAVVDEGPRGRGARASTSALPAVTVSADALATDDQVSFHVESRGGAGAGAGVVLPVVARRPAPSGPWRSEPNLMVVVPTSHDVTLTYGASGPDKLGLLLSVVGLVVLGVLVWRRFAYP